MIYLLIVAKIFLSYIHDYTKLASHMLVDMSSYRDLVFQRKNNEDVTVEGKKWN